MRKKKRTTATTATTVEIIGLVLFYSLLYIYIYIYIYGSILFYLTRRDLSTQQNM